MKTFHIDTWNLLLFCPELLQSFSLVQTLCVRVVTKFSESQQGVDVGGFFFLAPTTFVVARLSWQNGIPWLCCPIHKENSSTSCIHPRGLGREQEISNHHRAAIGFAHTSCTSTAVLCCHMSLSYEIYSQMEYIAKPSHCELKQPLD